MKKYYKPTLLLCTLGLFLFSPNASAQGQLPEPDLNDRATSIEPKVQLFTPLLSTKKILVLPPSKSLIVTIPFNKDGLKVQEKFGRLLDSQRTTIQNLVGTSQWQYLTPLQNKLLLLNGVDLSGYLLDEKTLQIIMPMTIVWDTILPPRDRGGEAPTHEIKELRARFKKAMHQTLVGEVKFPALAPLPSDWLGEKNKGKSTRDSHFILASRMPGFPLIIMNCQTDDVVHCRLSRTCFLNAGPDGFMNDVVGIFTLPKDRKIALINSKLHQMAFIKFHTCFHSTWEKQRVTFPTRLKTLVHAQIDSDERLWVATATPDDYTNSSLFYWPKQVWQKVINKH